MIRDMIRSLDGGLTGLMTGPMAKPLEGSGADDLGNAAEGDAPRDPNLIFEAPSPLTQITYNDYGTAWLAFSTTFPSTGPNVVDVTISGNTYTLRSLAWINVYGATPPAGANTFCDFTVSVYGQNGWRNDIANVDTKLTITDPTLSSTVTFDFSTDHSVNGTAVYFNDPTTGGTSPNDYESNGIEFYASGGTGQNWPSGNTWPVNGADVGLTSSTVSSSQNPYVIKLELA